MRKSQWACSGFFHSFSFLVPSKESLRTALIDSSLIKLLPQWSATCNFSATMWLEQELWVVFFQFMLWERSVGVEGYQVGFRTYWIKVDWITIIGHWQCWILQILFCTSWWHCVTPIKTHQVKNLHNLRKIMCIVVVVVVVVSILRTISFYIHFLVFSNSMW